MADLVNRPIPDDDPRVAAVGTLWADGRLVSHATVLAPGVAVAPSFGAAHADLLKIGRRGEPTRFDVLQVTARNPFAVLTYSDHVNRIRLGGGRMAVGAKLTFLAYDEKADQYFSAEGRVATTPGLQILLNPGLSILPSWTGAPAFDEEGLLTGMIGRGAGGPILLDVLPLDEMLGSCKELAGLLAPERAEQVRMSGVPTAAQGIRQVPDQVASHRVAQSATLNIVPNNPNAPRGAARDNPPPSLQEREKGEATPNPYRDPVAHLEGIPVERTAEDISQAERDAELWAKLSPSSREALARAEGIRLALGRDRLHTEDLIAGLFPSWKGFFAKAGLNEEDFRIIVKDLFGKDLPRDYRVPDLDHLPPLSRNLIEALSEAARYADERGAKAIWSTHLLYGALSAKGSKTAQTLISRGVRREDIGPEDGSETDLQESKADSQDSATATRSATPTITPSAKVESAAPGTPDAELFARLSPSGHDALERAEGMRRELGHNAVHLRHLLAGLFSVPGGSTHELLLRAGVDERGLEQIIQRTTRTVLPLAYHTSRLTEMPRASDSVHEALKQAARHANETGSGLIRDRHLFYGVLSVDGNPMIDALKQMGVRKEDLDQIVDGTDNPDKPMFEANITQVPAAVSTSREFMGYRDQPAGGASPTPKVDSDLWSEVDRLGYEAYARTIASLITHKDTVAPLTIGIKAPWGAGKTSLMKRVQRLLDGDASLTERNEAGLKQMWQQSTMTFWNLLRNLSRKTIIVDPERHEQHGAARGRARELLKEAVCVDALKPKESAEGRSCGISPRITVWFNAWRFQTSEQVWAGMAHCIISQIMARMNRKQRELFWLRLRTRRINAEQLRWRVWEAVLRQVLPFALVTVAAGVLLFGSLLLVPLLFPALALDPKLLVRLEQGIPFAGIIAVVWKTGAKLGDKAAEGVRDLVREPDYEDKIGYLAHVESDIRDVLKLASVTSKQPLVVFVDDLDRCAPNKVAEVVEAINLFLCGDYPNCIFVLGMEPGMVAAALEVANKDVIEKALEMGLMDRSAPVGWRFMEKIVQLPITIPPPTKRGRDSYVESLVGSSQVGSFKAGSSEPVAPVEAAAPKEEEVREFIQQMQGKSLAEVEQKSLKVVAEAPTEKKRAAAEAGKRVYANTFSERDPAIAEFVQDVAELVDGNPRQIKRYVNVFRFYSTLRYGLRADGIVAASDFPTDKVLAKFVALNIQWPHAVDCLRVKKILGAKGEAISRLQYLEEESARIAGEACDEEWKTAVDKSGAGSFAAASAFREFLKKGESLGKSLGQGLW
jgi:hypothetical protein